MKGKAEEEDRRQETGNSRGRGREQGRKGRRRRGEKAQNQKLVAQWG